MASFAFSGGLPGAFGPGLDYYDRLQALARKRAQDRGQADFLKYLLAGNQGGQGGEQPPSGATVPLPSASGPSGTAPAAGGKGTPAGTETTTQDTTSTSGYGDIPSSIRGYVQAIRKQDPGASPEEVMEALKSAMPYFDAQQKSDLARMKIQSDVDYKKARLGIDKEKADAYRDHMKQLSPAEQMAEGKKIVAKGAAIRARISYYQGLIANGQVTDPEQRKKVDEALRILNDGLVNNQNYLALWQSSRAGPAGASFEAANPPPDTSPEPVDGPDSQ